MIQFYSPRGFLIVAIGIGLVVSGAGLIDNSYQSVESMMTIKHSIIEDQIILPHKLLNSTISSDVLSDHNVILVHVKPVTDSIKFLAVDPSGETFEKESKDGFVYHIVAKQQQTGNYLITIYSQSNEPINVNAVIGQDPYLSGNCDQSYGLQCNTIDIYIGFVMVGIIVFIVGTVLVITDFSKQRKLRNK